MIAYAAEGRPRFGQVEQTRQQRVIGNGPTQVTIDRPDERAAYGARLDNADTIAADDANHRQEAEYGLPEKTVSEHRRGSHREGANYAAQFTAQAATSPEGMILASGTTASVPCVIIDSSQEPVG